MSEQNNNEPVLRVRLINIDTVQISTKTLAPPSNNRKLTKNIPHLHTKSPFFSDSLSFIPEVRVFGVTNHGEKCCMHIHGTFPYCYVEYTGSLEPNAVNEYIHTFGLTLNHALSMFNNESNNNNNNNKPKKYVPFIVLAKGVPFYGFHVGFSFYLKIYASNPKYMFKLVNLLRSGAIYDQKFQVYESHLPFLLQFLIDFNLYGCGWIDLADCKVRTSPLPLRLPSTCRYPTGLSPPTESFCQLEVDVHVSSILNRLKVSPRDLHHDFPSEHLQNKSSNAVVPSVRELWDDERSRRAEAGMSGPEEEVEEATPTPRLFSKNQGPEWSNQQIFQTYIQQMLKSSSSSSSSSDLTFENFVKRVPYQDNVRTTYEQVTALFPQRIQNDDNTDYNYGVYSSQNSNTYTSSPSSTTKSSTSQKNKSSQHVNIQLARDFVKTQQQQQQQSTLQVESLENSDNEDQDQDDINDLSDIGGRIINENENQQQNNNNDELLQEPSNNVKDLPSEPPLDTDIKNNTNNSTPSVISSFETPSHDSRELSILEADNLVSISNNNNNKLVDIGTGSSNNTDQNSGSDPSPPPPPKQSKINSPIPSLTPTETQTSNSSTSASFETNSKLNPSLLHVSDTILNTNTNTNSSDTLRNFESFTSRQPPEPISNKVTGRWKRYYLHPPAPSHLLSTLESKSRPVRQYNDPFFSNTKDVPPHSREYGGRSFTLKGSSLKFLKDFHCGNTSNNSYMYKKSGSLVWEYAIPPPSKRCAIKWLNQNKHQSKNSIVELDFNNFESSLPSDIHGPTQAGRPKLSDMEQDPETTRDVTMLSMELHANSRHDLLPDPACDPINAIFYCFRHGGDIDIPSNGRLQNSHLGILLVESANVDFTKLGLSELSITVLPDEPSLIDTFIQLVRAWDPEILSGYEIQNSSWGYLLERGQLVYNQDLTIDLGRTKEQSTGKYGDKTSDRWGFRKTSTIKITGRHTLPVWRIMRSNIDLLRYTLQNVAYHVLHKLVPYFSSSQLTQWYNDTVPSNVAKLFSFYIDWVQMNIEFLEEVDFITQTSEFARVFGVDFASVISRGSQFKVESIMARIAKPESFVLLSPSRQDVGKQNAAECIPLILEPKSAFYKGPLLVLDFTSLYPSCMIAYNYCYSTCLGRVRPFKGSQKLGVTNLDLPEGALELLKDHIKVSPNGLMFLKSNVRKSLLSKMLTEILDSRAMIKKSMKKWKHNKALMRTLEARQLGLKFIANVTYGYTSATMSGRMPCVEIADAIVQTGRETLENAKRTIHANKDWGAHVVYGDTDSLFVYLPGKTKESAFRIGNEIANTVTSLNPQPIRLKFEKVYLPCVLMAKKRYVGFKYESLEQTSPDFEGKGIETVRRDGFPAMQKMVETSLKILFRTQDLSEMKQYLYSQWTKIIHGKVSIQDFVYAKAVRLGTYSDNNKNLPPGVVVAMRMMAKDHRAEPQYGDRVAYLIPYGGDSYKQNERALTPHEFLSDPRNMLDAEHYIDATCRAVGRVLDLVGIDIWTWKREFPKRSHASTGRYALSSDKTKSARVRIDEHFKVGTCRICGIKSNEILCNSCKNESTESWLSILRQSSEIEKKVQNLQLLCSRCIRQNPAESVECISIDCPYYYSRVKYQQSLKDSQNVLEYLSKEW